MKTNAQTDNLLFAVNESPPLWMAMVLAFQHVLVMYGEVALFPGIAGKLGGAAPDHIAFATFAAIAVSGLCTLIQVVRFGKIGGPDWSSSWDPLRPIWPAQFRPCCWVGLRSWPPWPFFRPPWNCSSPISYFIEHSGA